jgi:hypothetical protein
MNAKADDEEFFLLEYQSLRNEIAVAKRNMFQLIIGGAAIVPAAQSLAVTYSIGPVTLALPLILVVLVLMFIAENRSMMRAGQYILENIEPRFGKKGGWESWLNTSTGITKNRSVDKILVFAFSVLSSFYFIVAVVLAWSYASRAFGNNGKYAVAVAYVAVGAVLAFILYSQAQTDTEVSDSAIERT